MVSGRMFQPGRPWSRHKAKTLIHARASPDTIKV